MSVEKNVDKSVETTNTGIRSDTLQKLQLIAENKREPLTGRIGIRRIDALSMVVNEYISNHPDCGALL